MTKEELLERSEFRYTKDNCKSEAKRVALIRKEENSVSYLRRIQSEIEESINNGYMFCSLSLWDDIYLKEIVEVLRSKGFTVDMKEDSRTKNKYITVEWGD